MTEAKRPRGRPRKDGRPAGSGPNAREPSKAGDRRLTVPLSLPKKSGEEIAASALAFLAGLTIPEGKLAGQPMQLAGFQERFVRGALADGVMVGVLSIGRGNAKTALSAGLSLGHLMGAWDDQPKREIIFCARNRDQAKTAFQFLTGFIEGLPEDQREQFIIRRGSKLEVEFEGNGGGLARVIAADGKSILGGAPTLAVMDERASWEREKGDNLENAILSGLGNAVIGAELDRVVISGAGGTEPLGIIPGAATYGITSTAVGAAAAWAAFRAEVVAFMEANAITSPSQVNLAFNPAIWADLDDALIAGTAVSQWDRLTKQVGTPSISNLIPAATALMTATVQGIAPGYLGVYGGIDLIRDPYTKAASGALVLTGLVTADFTVPRGMQTRILTGLAA